MKKWKELPGGAELEELADTKEFSETDAGHTFTFLGPLRYVGSEVVISGVNRAYLEFVGEFGELP